MFMNNKQKQIRNTLREELVIMKNTIKHVGLDVSKDKIAFSFAEEEAGPPPTLLRS